MNSHHVICITPNTSYYVNEETFVTSDGEHLTVSDKQNDLITDDDHNIFPSVSAVDCTIDKIVNDYSDHITKDDINQSVPFHEARPFADINLHKAIVGKISSALGVTSGQT